MAKKTKVEFFNFLTKKDVIIDCIFSFHIAELIINAFGMHFNSSLKSHSLLPSVLQEPLSSVPVNFF